MSYAERIGPWLSRQRKAAIARGEWPESQGSIYTPRPRPTWIVDDVHFGGMLDAHTKNEAQLFRSFRPGVAESARHVKVEGDLVIITGSIADKARISGLTYDEARFANDQLIAKGTWRAGPILRKKGDGKGTEKSVVISDPYFKVLAWRRANPEIATDTHGRCWTRGRARRFMKPEDLRPWGIPMRNVAPAEGVEEMPEELQAASDAAPGLTPREEMVSALVHLMQDYCGPDDRCDRVVWQMQQTAKANGVELSHDQMVYLIHKTANAAKKDRYGNPEVGSAAFFESSMPRRVEVYCSRLKAEQEEIERKARKAQKDFERQVREDKDALREILGTGSQDARDEARYYYGEELYRQVEEELAREKYGGGGSG